MQIFSRLFMFLGEIAGADNTLDFLDSRETLSPGQSSEIERVYSAYPHLNDDVFVAENLDRWMN